jgi:serine protease Do
VPFTPGALVNVVGRGSPAEAAGLRPNDVIVEIAGHPVESYRRLPTLVTVLRPGEKAKIAFLRQGKRQEATVTIGAQGGGAQAGELEFFGARLRPLDRQESAALGLRPGEGLAVVDVDPRGPASGALDEGDVLLALDGQPVTAARLGALGKKLEHGRRSSPSVLIIQRGGERFALRI